MKKLFMLLFVACMATFGISCNPEKIESGKDKWDQIELTADKTEIEEGEVVTFETKVKGEKLEGAILYREGKPASSPVMFSTEGVYKMVAKKNRYKDSEVILVTVKGKIVAPKETLVLTADKTDVKVGETVTFIVKAEGKDVVADIYIDGTKVANPYKFEKAGTFKAVAKKANYTDSNAVSVVVKDDVVGPGIEPGIEL